MSIKRKNKEQEYKDIFIKIGSIVFWTKELTRSLIDTEHNNISISKNAASEIEHRAQEIKKICLLKEMRKSNGNK